MLIKNIPYAFLGQDDTNPWNAVASIVNGFNNTRIQKVAASFCKVLDESMSAWSPTTTKLGGLLFLLFILCKPTPLGTDFKTVACTKMGEIEIDTMSSLPMYCCLIIYYVPRFVLRYVLAP